MQKKHWRLKTSVCLIYLALLAWGETSALASQNSNVAFTVNQLMRQFTLRNTVAQVNQGLQGHVLEVGGKLRGLAMGSTPTNFPADMGSVPTGVGLPTRDGAGRPLGYCAWDNTTSTDGGGFLGGSGIINPMVYAVVSPGLNGAIDTSCADIETNRVASGDDYLEIRYPLNTASQQFKTAVNTVTALNALSAVDGDVRLVLENNKLYIYNSGVWVPVSASGVGVFEDDSATNGANAISHTTGKVTVAEFAATSAALSANLAVTGTSTLTGAVTASNGLTVSAGGINVTGASSITGNTTLTGDLAVSGALTAATFSGNGSALTNLSASNISTGVLGAAYGGTGVNASAAANGALLIGNGSGFSLGTLLGTADQVMVSNGAGSIQLSLPQAISATSTPTFGGLVLNGALTSTTGTFSGALTAQRLNIGDSTGGLTRPNIIIGTGAMAAVASGNGGNTAIGINSLAANTSGYFNTAIGHSSLINNTTGERNFALGFEALYSNTTGSGNIAIGEGALRQSSTASNNIAIGQGSMYSNLTGSSNLAMGRDSMFANTTGADNVALGQNVLRDSSSGNRNTGVGFLALEKNTTGSSSTALGYRALSANTTGQNNVALGASAGFETAGGSNTNANTTGSNNTFLGSFAMPGTTTQLSYATALGSESLVNTNNTIVLGRTSDTTVIGATGTASSGILQNKILQVTGDVGVSGALALGGALSGTTGTFSGALTVQRLNIGDSTGGVTYPNIAIGIGAMSLGTPSGYGANVAIGTNALTNNSSGASNTAVGGETLRSNTTGSYNTAIGDGVLYANTTGGDNTGVGTYSLLLNTTGYENTAVGSSSLFFNTTGHNNTGVGAYSLQFNDSGYENTAVGSKSLYENTSGFRNTAVGREALASNTSGWQNNAVGRVALTYNTTGYRNNAMGDSALYFNTTGFDNTAMGNLAINSNTTGERNTGMGSYVMRNTTTGSFNTSLGAYSMHQNTTGSNNTATGYYAMYANTTGTGNAAFGFAALDALTSGSDNLVLGYEAGSRNGGYELATGSNNTFLGSYSGRTMAASSLSYATAIGSYAEVGTDNTIVLGRTSDTTVIGATGTASSGILQNKKLQVTGDVGVSGALALGGALTGTTASFSDAVSYANQNTIPVARNVPTTVGGTVDIGTFNVPANGTPLFELNLNSQESNWALNKRYVIAGGFNPTGGQWREVIPQNSSGPWVGNDYALDMQTTATTISFRLRAVSMPFPAINGVIGNLKVIGGYTSFTASSATGSAGVTPSVLMGSGSVMGVVGDKVGIGTASPAATLDVVGTANISGALALGGALTGTTGTFTGALTAQRLIIGDSTGGVTQPNLVIGTDAMALGTPSGLGANTSVGIGSLANNTSGNLNVAVGIGTLYTTTTGSKNVVVGDYSMYNNTTGYENVAVGSYSLPANTVGYGNVAVGREAMVSNTSGNLNVAIGHSVLYNNTTGYRNVSVGEYSTYHNTTGYENSAFGAGALFANTVGIGNVALGREAMVSNTSGNSNVAVGHSAMLYNSTGSNNAAMGYYALNANTTGTGNAAFGFAALDVLSSGSDNLVMGYEAGSRNGGYELATGSNNTFLGSYSGRTLAASSLSFATAIGSYAEVGTDNTIVLGRASDVTVIGGTGDDASGNKLQVVGSVKATAFNTSSDRRLKTNINMLGDDLLTKLGQMNAYNYRFIADPTAKMRYGVIAQEIALIFPDAISYDGQGLMAVDYGALGAIAAAGVGKLNTRLNTLNTKVDTHGEKITALEKDMQKVDDRVKSLEAWKTEANTRMDSMQTALDLNVKQIAEHALKIASNTEKITTLEQVTQEHATRLGSAEEGLGKLNAQWSSTFAKSEDGNTLTVLTPNLVASNFTAQQIQASSAYTQRLEAEMARIAQLEVDDLRANKATTGNLRATEVNTGSAQVFANTGSPAYLFTTAADGHYTVNVSAADGSYITASVMVSSGVAKVVTVSNDGINLLAEGTMVKALANGKLIKASWIKMG